MPQYIASGYEAYRSQLDCFVYLSVSFVLAVSAVTVDDGLL